MLHSHSLYAPSEMSIESVGAMSVSLSPFTHISNTDSRLDCACAFPSPTTPQLLPLLKAANPEFAFVCFSQRVLPIQELHMNVDDGDHSHVSVCSYGCLSNGNEVFRLGDSLNPLSDEILKERIRRMRIGLANKGKVPWNKGKKHSAETRELIKQRTLEALRNPKVRKKMAEHPNSHSDQIKAKISNSLRRVWHERLKSKRSGDQFVLSWEQCLANAAKKGGSGQEELDWDSYDKIKQQLEPCQLLQTEKKKKKKKKPMTVCGAKKFIQSWRESIAKAAKKGGNGEQELDWDSYEKIQEEMAFLRQLQHTTKKEKAKEMARMEKAKEAASIKAIIKKVMLPQKRKDRHEKAKARRNTKSPLYRSAKEHEAALEVTQEFKLHSKFTKIHPSKSNGSEVAREGKVFNSIFRTDNKLDLELIKRVKMQKEISLADQIKAVRDQKGKLQQ
ncbi:hypothetical protein RJT34_02370 [Clitoria ternatea]|uniref:Nuclease associated modular domain-containing protein n=1 Tax=Clitoria ternatea TaxID=43366 RepID=A0AAN9KJX2_CLITE